MAVGLPVTKSEIDTRAGDIARRFQQSFEDVLTMQQYLSATLDVDLVNMGFTQEDVGLLKASFADLEQLGKIWMGSEPLAAPKDFRTYVRKLWGVGAF